MKKALSLGLCYALCQAAPSNTLGIGLFISAEGGGLDAKYNLNAKSALDFRLSWSPHEDRFYYKNGVRYVSNDYYAHNALRFQMDYALQNRNAIKIRRGKMPVYYGIGAAFQSDDGFQGFALRMPLGIAFEPSSVPLDFFLEIPLEAHFGDYYYQQNQVDLNPALGLRFWF